MKLQSVKNANHLLNKWSTDFKQSSVEKGVNVFKMKMSKCCFGMTAKTIICDKGIKITAVLNTGFVQIPR